MGIEDDLSEVRERVSLLENLVAKTITTRQVVDLGDSGFTKIWISARVFNGFDIYGGVIHPRYSRKQTGPPQDLVDTVAALVSEGLDLKISDRW